MCCVSGGYVAGDCSAGYFCLAGSDEYTPTYMTPDPVTRRCEPGLVCAGPCPAGYYCLEGTVDPAPCPEHTLRAETGARTFNECGPCPAGNWCHAGECRTAWVTRCECYRSFSANATGDAVGVLQVAQCVCYWGPWN